MNKTFQSASMFLHMKFLMSYGRYYYIRQEAFTEFYKELDEILKKLVDKKNTLVISPNSKFLNQLLKIFLSLLTFLLCKIKKAFSVSHSKDRIKKLLDCF